VSRKTGYKWLARHESHGPCRLTDMSRAPHNHPRAVSNVRAAILNIKDFLHTGALARSPGSLARSIRNGIHYPAKSTIGALLKQGGACFKTS